MIATYQGPIIDDAPSRARVVDILRTAAGRAGGTTLLAWLALVALSMAWDRLHFVGPVGEWPPAGNFPQEFWLSVLAVEVVICTLLVAALLVADVIVDRGGRTSIAYTVALVAASAAGAWLQVEVRRALGLRLMVDMPGIPRDVAIALPLYVFFDSILRNAVFVAIYANRRTTLRARARMRAAELERARAQRRTLESRLQALQARVEPQFLFNTLAQVRDLHALDPRLAGVVLDDLITYLRAALPHLRESTSTLGQEVALAQSYLRILRARSGAHATIAFDLPDELRDAPMPPMVLLPLIDATAGGNAAHRGALHVATAERAGRLRIAISGSRADVTSRDAWRVIGERLHALYGDAAALRVEAAGAEEQAVVEIPRERPLRRVEDEASR